MKMGQARSRWRRTPCAADHRHHLDQHEQAAAAQPLGRRRQQALQLLLLALQLSGIAGPRLAWAGARGFLPPEDKVPAEFDIPKGEDRDRIMRQFNTLQHQHIWQTLDGTRKYLGHLKDLKQDRWMADRAVFETVGAEDEDGATGPGASAALHEHHTPRCAGTLGQWCQKWWDAAPVPVKPALRGSKACKHDCHGVGVCNLDIGVCQCPIGFGGDDCGKASLRPCTNRFSDNDDPVGVPSHHLDLTTNHDRDLGVPGWTASRCTGYCDTRNSACFCGYNSTYGHVPAPPGSPPGTPPIRQGRPMHDGCKARTDAQGKMNEWGVQSVTWDKLYGEGGWCEAEHGKTIFNCACINEDMAGWDCSEKREVFCPNQCNARGQCELGFCKCDPGWYGTSCDRKRAGEEIEPVKPERLKRFMKQVWKEPLQSMETPAVATRKRPLIFIYDLPTDYNAKILGMRLSPGACIWRKFSEGNHTEWLDGVYVLENYFHDTLAGSPHRTLDPEEADFFYLPLYLSCYTWPVLGWADGPWYYAPTVHPRTMHQMHIMLEAKRWVQEHYPYWDRNQGRDHIFLHNHDEAPCYAPSEVYNTSIFLSHWGRRDPDHISGSAWPADNYTTPVDKYPKHQNYDWRDLYRGHPCYTPGKDLLVPAFKQPHTFQHSPILGMPPYKRDILLFFRADVGLWREWWYSRGIRQSLFRLAMEDKWREKYKILIGMRETYPGDYSIYLARSKFCLVTQGDGWSGRSEDAVLHGCIPVIINDNVEPILHGLVDWGKFSVRVPQARLHELPQILQAYTDKQVRSMQRALARVWTRFMYATGPGLQPRVQGHITATGPRRNQTRTPPQHPLRPLSGFPKRQDAFHTIMHWLHSRIPYAKGEATLEQLTA